MAVFAALLGSGSKAAEPADIPQPAWGTISRSTEGPGTFLLGIQHWPKDGRLVIPQPFAEITSAKWVHGVHRESLKWIFNRDSTELSLDVTGETAANLPASILVETAERTGQFPGGRIVFSPTDAKVTGTAAKLESSPGNHRIANWTNAYDFVTWDFKPTRWGMYDIELTYAAAGGGGTELQVELAGKAFKVARPSTGSWDQYASLPIGRFYLEKAQPFTLKVGCATSKGEPVANLKAVTFRPASEGVAIIQSGPGPIILAASNAITHSVMMRYEPATNKNCLGYWVNANDWAEWEFTVTRPGTYEVEMSHGAGKGQGGDILLEVNGAKFSFATADTGDIHKHTGLRVGTVTFAAPGDYSLAVKPQKKYGGAIMDIDAVNLLPVDKP
jgi:hypothetical protein